MKSFLIFFTFLALFVSNSISSQNYFSQTISEKLNDYNVNKYPEKIYVHTDKSVYTNTETIWFSAYLVNGITLQKTQKSYVIYAELINEKDSILDRKKIFAKDINSSGDFLLNEKLSSGNYRIRAYTNYMRNQSSDYFFQKNITIIKPSSKVDKSKRSEKKEKDSLTITAKEFKPNINFYPQGGYLVNGLMNKVGVKFKDEIFNKINLTCIIRDQDENEITRFKSGEFGLGAFSFIPEEGKTYFANIEKDDKTYTYKIPKPLEKGFLLNVINNQKDLLINLNSTTINGLLGATLLIHERGKLIFNQTFKEAKNQKNLKIPIYKLNSGILHLTLFNSNAQPVCERLVFIDNNTNNAVISINKPKEYFGNRRKVTLKINVENIENKGIPSKLSMSVTDVRTFGKSNISENIKTWLLLNSDLRGKIENPNYFFEGDNMHKRKYLLDLIMLTHGWRRFTWQETIANSSKELKYNPEKGIKIEGKTLQMKAPYSIKSVPTRLTFMGKIIEQEPIKKSNEKGEYSYGPFVFFDSIPILLEARLTDFKSKNEEDRKVLIMPKNTADIAKIEIDSTVIKKIKSKKDIQSYLKYQGYLSEINAKFKQSDNVLDEIVINSKLKNEKNLREEEMNSRTSYGNSFNRFDVEKDGFATNTALSLFYSVPGVTVVNDSIRINRFRNVTPLILFDEVQIDISDLSMITADEVSFIDVLTGGEAMLFSSNGAVISIYSKLGNGYNSNKNIKRKPGIIDFKMAGFYTAQEFYAPDHINGIEEQTKADTRITLHWEPNISISDNKAVEISFFTSDIDSKYVIEIEGITTSGIPLYKTTEIIVD